LDDDGVKELQAYIVRSNVHYKELFKNGWFTSNTHIAKHILNATSRIFLSAIHGKIGQINNSRHKQDQPEKTRMTTVIHQQAPRQSLVQSTDLYWHGRLLRRDRNRSKQERERRRDEPP